MPTTRSHKPTARRRNTSAPASLADLDATKCDLPSSAVKLTAAEKKLLKDPDWIDEDEADTILALRELKKDKHRAIPFEEYLKKSGVRVQR